MCQKGAHTEGRVAVPTGRLCKARLGMNYLPVSVLNQGDQGENLIPPSLILIPDIPNIPNIPNTGVPGVPWVPRASGAC
jgi:hypothetical protein